MSRRFLTLFIPLLTFAVALVVFGALSGRDGGGASADQRAADAVELTGGLSPDERIERLETLVRAGRGGPSVATQLGEAYLQKTRETGDTSFLAKAEELFKRAARRAPRDPEPLTGLGTIALARHDFAEALTYGRRALRLAPETVRPYAVLVDAQVELGRFDAAARDLQRMIDRKPNLASYARVSYFRELSGDLDGAVEAMRLAVSAGSGSDESVAYVQTLLGNLEFTRGRTKASAEAYDLALERSPGYVPALVGRAQLDASGGRLDRAVRALKAVTDRNATPEYLIAHGEAELARGNRAAAAKPFSLMDDQRRQLEEAGFSMEAEFVLFEADYGSASEGVALGRQVWQASPGLHSADALGWALHRAGKSREGLTYARKALRLGSRDPLFLTHAGLTARAAGRPDLARRWLRQALVNNPNFSAVWAPRARRALRALAT